jgi:hypothetical protein
MANAGLSGASFSAATAACTFLFGMLAARRVLACPQRTSLQVSRVFSTALINTLKATVCDVMRHNHTSRSKGTWMQSTATGTEKFQRDVTHAVPSCKN